MTNIQLPLALFLLFLSPALLRSEEAANLTGFDAESQAYIRSHQNRVFQWLMPFCSDLTPYLAREEPLFSFRLGGTGRQEAQKACQHFQKQYIPDGWSYDGWGRNTLKDWVPNSEQGGTRFYRRVPNTICPVHTAPNGNPVGFLAWEHRTGDVKVAMLQCYFLKTEMIIVAHKDGGLGVANPTPVELATLARQYFQLPPIGLVVPKDWEPLFEIEQRDQRFLSGTLSAKYSDESDLKVVSRLDSGEVVSWGRRKKSSWRCGGFFYDGFNLALFVNPIKNGAPSTTPAIVPHDVDWDLVEKKERETAEKKKAETSARVK